MLNWRDPKNPLSGGAERVTQGYLSALAQRGHHVSWFTFGFPNGSPEETIDGINIIRRGGTVSSILHAWKWSRRQPRFNLVIDQIHGIPWYAPWWTGTRCVAYLHEVLGPIWNAFYPWPINRVGRWQERWTYRRYANVPFWTGCHATRNDLLALGVSNVTVIPYGVWTTALPELESKPIGTPLRLIAVSRLAPNKRIDHAIRAVSVLLQRGINATLDIIGAGERELALRQIAGPLADAVTFHGSLPEPAKDAHLRRAHLLLHTSQREGWGLNVIEANAMGTPSAVYPVRGLTESTLDEETGVVAAHETPEALADRIASLLQRPNDYDRMRLNAWNRAKTFHWDAILPKACDWLESQARGDNCVASPYRLEL